MNSNPSARAEKPLSQSAHTLVEVMVSVALLGFMVVSLYAGFASGFSLIRIAKENLRATQILEEKMEVIRLVRWQDVTNNGFIPLTFTAPFYANDPSNATPGGFVYTGTVAITNVPFSASYTGSLRMIQINLTWTSADVTHTQQMVTYASQYGLQNYIY